MRKFKYACVIAMLINVLLSACRKDDNLPGVWPDLKFQISLTDDEGVSTINPETDAVILSYQGSIYRLGVKETMIGDSYSYAMIKNCNHTENGLYLPRQDIILSFSHDEWMRWRNDETVFSININNREYDVKQIGESDYGKCQFTVNEETGTLVNWNAPYGDDVYNYFRINVGWE